MRNIRNIASTSNNIANFGLVNYAFFSILVHFCNTLKRIFKKTTSFRIRSRTLTTRLSTTGSSNFSKSITTANHTSSLSSLGYRTHSWNPTNSSTSKPTSNSSTAKPTRHTAWC
ncbi:hypothetical protein [Circovirus-like genome DHCV-2]|uniref:Uncharacterized protein n=1 Tax=Circovirus-like genome DHCV-2 TaxID=1788451 RepID=A0A190WHN0_9VIRU|nr:hypothetical protein [Circovirus-like genome DHCV-2]AMB43000.1 hypothetical protein [Circovirus-like genome DHCV-2]